MGDFVNTGKWLHIDMAGKSVLSLGWLMVQSRKGRMSGQHVDESGDDGVCHPPGPVYNGERATGYGVALLVSLLAKLT